MRGVGSERIVGAWWQFAQILGEEAVGAKCVSAGPPGIGAVDGGEQHNHPFSLVEKAFAVSDSDVSWRAHWGTADLMPCRSGCNVRRLRLTGSTPRQANRFIISCRPIAAVSTAIYPIRG